MPDRQTRIIPPTLVCHADDTMAIMREEIFGPVLVVPPYESIDEVFRYVSARPIPFGPRAMSP